MFYKLGMIIGLSFSLLVSTGLAQGRKKKQKVIYKYKKYQKFDFENLTIEGETGSPGDISVFQRNLSKYKNNLPYRKNFNAEIRKGMERIR